MFMITSTDPSAGFPISSGAAASRFTMGDLSEYVLVPNSPEREG
jgi:hypothetical protein